MTGTRPSTALRESSPRARIPRPSFWLAALLLPLVLVGCGPAPAPTPPTRTPEPLAWRPPDAGVAWGAPEVSVATPQQLGACQAGSTTTWRAGPEWVSVVDWDCGTNPAAIRVVGATLGTLRALPASDVPPALGEGRDVAVHYTDGSLVRLWSEAGHYLWVRASCGFDDCPGRTADYVAALSEQLLGDPNPLLADPLIAGDTLASFRPSGEDGWALVSDDLYEPKDLAVPDCQAGRNRSWVSEGRLVTRVYVMQCADAAQALRAYTTQWGIGSGLRLRSDLAGVLGPGVDSAGQFAPSEQTAGVARSWVQGNSYVNVQRLCDPALLDQCITGSRDDTVALRAKLPGDPVSDSRTIDLATGLVLFGIGLPLAALAAIAIFQAISMRRRQGGYAIADRPDFTAVDQLVRRARIGRVVRRVLVAGFTAGLWLLGLSLLSSPEQLVFFGLWFFFAPFLLAVILSGSLTLVWRPSPLVRASTGPRGRLTWRSVLGGAMRVLARGLGAAAIVLYVITSMVLVFIVKAQTPAVTSAQISNGYRAGTASGWMMSLIEDAVVRLESVGGYPLLFVVVVLGPLGLSQLLDRLGRRLSQRSLQALLAQDHRPHFLYLRGFEEDTLRTDGALSRRGFLEALSPFGRPRFEEVLVSYLSRFGPVIAISQHSQVVPELGAAKMSFGGDEWQAHVLEWMDDARAVVMAATPAQVRAGLEWEIEQLAEPNRTPGIMLVVSPWPRGEIGARWQGFLDRASAWARFAPLACDPFPSGAQVLTWTQADGWRGYGSRRRWDWTYAAAILAGVEAASAGWTAQRAATSGMSSAAEDG